MSDKNSHQLEKLWQRIGDPNATDAVTALKELFTALEENNQTTEAIQVGWEWVRLTDEGIGTLAHFEAVFNLSLMLYSKDMWAESSALVDKALNYQDFPGLDFERGMLHWQQSSNWEEAGDPCRQLAELLKAIPYLTGRPPEGLVRREAGAIQLKLGLYDDASLMLSTAILLLEEGAEIWRVADAKYSLAEVLLKQNHLTMALATVHDAMHIYRFINQDSLVKECQLLEVRIESQLGHEDVTSKFTDLMACGTGTLDRKVAARAHFYFGEHLARVGLRDEAAEMFTKAAPILRASGQSQLADQIPNLARNSQTESATHE
jgi:tetratricopeptide (TPR) repeat protein